jgi:hypothetical protein
MAASVKKLRKRFKTIWDNTSQNRSHWKEIADYFAPRRGGFLTSDSQEQNKGEKVHGKILNAVGTKAVRILAAGMHGGMTRPSTPWFRMVVSDENLMEFAPVRSWLHDVRSAMLTVLQKSNFYGAAQTVYTEEGLFGFNAGIIDEDFDTVIRITPTTIGEAYTTLDDRQRPSSLYRSFWMTVEQMAMQFGMDQLPEQIRAQVRNEAFDEKHIVCHVIYPRGDREPGNKSAANMPYASVYFLRDSGPEEHILLESGYRSIPFYAPRWEVSGTEIYGTSPGVDSLADCKQIQKMETDKLVALDKVVNPPMNAPASMRNTGGTVVPGGVNYLDVAQGGQGFTPAYQINPNLQQISMEIREVEQRLREHFFTDLFLAVINETKRMTATEVAQRHEEKLLMLGPVIERLQSEFHDVVIDRTFQIMESLKMFPPPPPEIQGMPYKVEYISLLAQAQKAVGTASIERVAGFVGNLAAVNPEVLDKFDMDEAVDQYGDMLGVPPAVIRSDDDVAKIRDARAQQQAQAAQMQQAAQMAQGAKVLSDVKLDQNTALDTILGR